MQLTLYSIPNFIVSIYTLCLGIFVLSSKPKARVNQICFLLTILTFFWLFFYGLLYSTINPRLGLIFAKIGHTAAVLIAPTIYLFAVTALGRFAQRKDIILMRVYSALVYIVYASSFITYQNYMPGIRHYYWGYFPIGGPIMLILAVASSLVALRITIIMIMTTNAVRRELGEHEYQQLKYYSLSLILFMPALVEYLPKFGFQFYPIGCIFVAAFTTVTSYAIVTKKLYDVNIIIRRSFVYSLLISILTFIYLVLILVSEHFFRGYFRYSSLFTAILISIFIALFFNPLRLKIQNFIDARFYKIDPEKIIRENQLLRSAIEDQDRLRAVAMFASGTAHEIKNPLAVIKTFTDHLAQKYDDPEFREKFIRLMPDEVERMNHIVKQLLDFSRPQEPLLAPHSIRALLEDVMSLMDGNFNKSCIRVTKMISHDALVRVDKNQLKQAFLNILFNAVQCMPKGGTIKIQTVPHPDSVCVSISDTGPGIPNKDLPHIFEPFFSKRDGGTGLGLSIVHAIITRHGGTVSVESEEGKGTTFNVTLKNLD